MEDEESTRRMEEEEGEEERQCITRYQSGIHYSSKSNTPEMPMDAGYADVIPQMHDTYISPSRHWLAHRPIKSTYPAMHCHTSPN